MCVTSCKRSQRDSAEPENSIFRNNLLKGISTNLDYYLKNKAFTVEETRPGYADPPNFPSSWYTVKNDAIEIAFWPVYDSNEGKDIYRLQWVDIKQKTTKYTFSEKYFI